MKKSTLLLLTLLPLGLWGQQTEMLSEGSYWCYFGETDRYYAPETDDQVYVTTGERSADGYVTIEGWLMAYGAKPSGTPATADKVVARRPQPITFRLREEEGRILAPKEEYLSMMAYYIDDAELPEVYFQEYGEDEVVLYDFTLQAGDHYPCKGDVTVESVEPFRTSDGISRKLFTLSNGLRIIEGIGCINSTGDLYAYQNVTTVMPEWVQDNGLYGRLRSFSVDEGYQFIYRYGDIERRMTMNDGRWYYGYANDEDNTPGSVFSLLPHASETIDGKEYALVQRVASPADEAEGSMTFHLREDDGRVLGRKDEYVQMMSQLYGRQEPTLFIEDVGEGEILLYDFTLQVGDRYPCKVDATVVLSEEFKTHDGITRRMLTLSNGVQLIEGIGCINAGGELLGYQNMNTIYVTADSYIALNSYCQQVAGDETDVYRRDDVEHRMLIAGNRWNYFASGKDSEEGISYRIEYPYNGEDTVTSNGYYKVIRKKGNEEKTFLLREEGGKVYAFAYEHLLRELSILPTGEDIFSEYYSLSESVLYDFTLQVGDRYPCKGDVTVSTIDEVTTMDLISRKQFTLSNGLIIIEGVGCINSSGDLFTYQNMPVAEDLGNEASAGCLQLMWKDAGALSCHVYEDNRQISGIKTGYKSQMADDKCYDLQGRMLQSSKVTKSQSNTLPTGVYIVNGKKVMLRK